VRCSIQLFGGLRVTLGDQVITRFSTRKNAALLAYLAYRLGQTSSREALIELLWPESEPELGRRSLRTALASLRRQLEPPGIPAGAVLQADRTGVRLNPANVETDVRAFEQSLRAASACPHPPERIRLLTTAVDACPGRLLPELYDDWIYPEQERLAEAFQQAVRQLVQLLEEAGRPDEALATARRGAAADPLCEETRGRVISLLAAAGRAEAALREYADLEAVLQRELGAAPAAGLRSLAATLRQTAAALPAGAAAAAPSPPRPAASGPPPAPQPARPILPLTATRLFGRDRELETLTRWLTPGPEAVRVATLTGLGGVGKTRLAIEAARTLAEAYAGRVTFVPLAEVREPELIPEALAAALRLPPAPRGDRTAQVLDHLADGPALLVLDNFEQVAAGGAGVVWTLAARLPELGCLVTSRAALALPIERRLTLRPLPLPATAPEPEEVLRSPAAAFFLERCQAVRPDFSVTRANAGVVVQLLHLLEGMPLALELAAARSGVLTPTQMVELLSRHNAEFASRERNRPERHRSLRACLAWSYDLLPERLARFFAALSVFRGGCSPEAAAAVAGEEAAPATTEALDALAQLRGWSLVQPEEAESGMRFRMLETVREFAAAQVPGPARGPLRRRHAAYFRSIAEAANAALGGPDQAARLSALEADHDNLRAALEFCAGQRDEGEAGLGLAGTLWRFWEVRGHLAEGRRRLATALAHPGAQAPTAPRAAALHGAASLAVLQGDFGPVEPLFAEGIRIRRALGDQAGVAAILNTLGNMAWDRSEFDQARAHYEESLRLRREVGDAAGIAGSLGNLASVLQKQGDLAGARALREESLARFREVGDRRAIAVALGHLGIAAYERADQEAARALYEESLAIRRELGDQLGIATCLSNLGLVADAQGDATGARALHEESLALRRELGDRRGMAYSLANLGNLATAAGDWTGARAFQAESLALRLGLGDRRGAAGVVADCARRALAEGNPALAARLGGAVERYLEEAGGALTPDDSAALAAALAAAEQALGPADYEAARLRGRSLSVEEAAESALGALPR
jgi:predicted ATPase/DNA-binding SARP family transcriptional activator